MMWNLRLFSTALLLGSAILGQQAVPLNVSEQQKAFNLAIRLERLQQFDKAEEIYRDLLRQNPRDGRVYLQLKHLYRRQEKIPALDTLLTRHLGLFPDDLQSHADRGELFLIKGDTLKALESWDSVLDQYYGSKPMYRILIQMYVRHQLDPQLEALVQRGRIVFDDPSLFSLELGNIYFSRQNYEKAAHEFLNFAIYHPREARAASGQLLRMSDQFDSQLFIETKIVERMPENEDVVRLLYSDFLFKTGRYGEALQQHLALGISTREDLDRWLQFAENLRKDNQLPLALDAFSTILDNIPPPSDNPWGDHYRKLTGQALYGLALTYEEQILPPEQFQSLADYFQNNVFFEDHFHGLHPIQIRPLEETFALYDSILITLPSSTFSPQAHFRLGEIKYRITGDYDGALESYRSALVLSKDPMLTTQVATRISDVLMARGSLHDALAFLDEKISTAGTGDVSNIYRLKKCQVLFLSGGIDSTLNELNGLISNLDITDAYLNDALELRGFIEENYSRNSNTETGAFKMYLNGEHLLKQGKLTEAHSAFSDVGHRFPESSIADEAIFRQAEIDLKIGNYDAAVSTFASLKDSPRGDRATVKIGEIYDHHLNDKQEAIRWYLAVLEDYSSSLLAEPVRYRIREISSKEETP